MISSLKRRVAGAFAAASFLTLCLAPPVHADAGEARRLLARSLGLMAHGNYATGRQLAKQAVAADPQWGLAHAVLARAALYEGDGVSAEAELIRARDTGFDMARVQQLFAHARLLQGDAAGAIGLAGKAAPAYRAYAWRIQAKAKYAMGDPLAAAQLLDAAADAAPGDSGVWTDIGRLRFQIGDSVGAIEAASRAVALDGDNVDALILRGQLVREQFGLAATLPWFEAALKRDPHHFEALVEYAATLGDAGRASDMLAAARRAIAVRGEAPQPWYLLAVLAARANNYDLARDLLARTDGQVDGMPGPLLLGALLDMKGGANQQAAAKLRNLVAVQPMNIEARQLLGVALLRTDAAADALDVLRPVGLRSDADSYTLTLAARAFERVGDRAMAATLLDRAAHPGRASADSFTADDSVPTLSAIAGEGVAGQPDTVIPLIRGMLSSGDRDQAAREAAEVAAANPGSAQAAIVLGDTLMATDKPQLAARAFQRAASIRFDEPAMLRLTEALEQAGDRAGAANALALFLSQNPRNLAGQRLAAHWQVAAGDYAAAVDSLEDLRARAGDRDPALLAELAYAYAGLKKLGEAERYAAAAYAAAPSNAVASDAYGWTMLQAGRVPAARQLLEKAVTIAPRHPGIRWHLAQLYAGEGRNADARAQAEAALADPRFADREAARQLVAAIG